MWASAEGGGGEKLVSQKCNWRSGFGTLYRTIMEVK